MRICLYSRVVLLTISYIFPAYYGLAYLRVRYQISGFEHYNKHPWTSNSWRMILLSTNSMLGKQMMQSLANHSAASRWQRRGQTENTTVIDQAHFLNQRCHIETPLCLRLRCSIAADIAAVCGIASPYECKMTVADLSLTSRCTQPTSICLRHSSVLVGCVAVSYLSQTANSRH